MWNKSFIQLPDVCMEVRVCCGVVGRVEPVGCEGRSQLIPIPTSSADGVHSPVHSIVDQVGGTGLQGGYPDKRSTAIHFCRGWAAVQQQWDLSTHFRWIDLEKKNLIYSIILYKKKCII